MEFEAFMSSSLPTRENYQPKGNVTTLHPDPRVANGRLRIGEHTRSRVAIGALADGIPKFYRKCMRFKDVAGEGAGHHTRGRVCSPECFAPVLGEDLGLQAGRPGANPFL
jgi:hypothetical protein